MPGCEPATTEIDLEFFDKLEELEEELAEDNGAPLIVVAPRVEYERLAPTETHAEHRTVWLDLSAATAPRNDTRTLIRGRGVSGYYWATRAAHYRWQVIPLVVRYGDEPEQVADLRLPPGNGPHPIFVLLHGGYWYEQWERDSIEPLAIDLVGRGYATLNLEYRRTGPGGRGGWPSTFVDVAAGIDYLAELARQHPIDLNRVAVMGHSAGGHLALWSAARSHLPSSAPGAQPTVKPSLALSLAGVVDLTKAAQRAIGLAANPVATLMGGLPEEYPERYAAACPTRLGYDAFRLLVQGTADDPDLVDLNRMYRDNHEVELLEIEGADHFKVIAPESSAWSLVVDQIKGRFPAEPAAG